VTGSGSKGISAPLEPPPLPEKTTYGFLLPPPAAGNPSLSLRLYPGKCVALQRNSSSARIVISIYPPGGTDIPVYVGRVRLPLLRFPAPFVYSSGIVNKPQEQDDFVPTGYGRGPLCEVLVNRADLVGHIRHGGCRLYKPRERELIAAGQGETPCPICREAILRTALRDHLAAAHPEPARQPHDERPYRFSAARPVGG